MTPSGVTPVTVSPAAPAATPAAATPAAAAPDLTTLQAELTALKTQVAEKDRAAAEHQRTAEFWFNKANAKPDAPKPAAAEEPEVDVLELATKGGKAFEAYMAKWAKDQGFVKGDAMAEAINTKAAELAAQGELLAQYPDLKNDKSEFFQATALEYGQLKKQGVSERMATKLAAERTELNFLRGGKLKTPAQQAADKAAEKEQQRRERAAAGGGERGAPRAPENAEDDDTLSADDERAVAQLADGLDIPLDQARERYIKRAKMGVRVALKLDRRGR